MEKEATKQKRPRPAVPRRAYSVDEFAAMANKDRGWGYRQIRAGKVKALTGYGSIMIPASEIERIFGEMEVAS